MASDPTWGVPRLAPSRVTLAHYRRGSVDCDRTRASPDLGCVRSCEVCMAALADARNRPRSRAPEPSAAAVRRVDWLARLLALHRRHGARASRPTHLA